MAKQTEKNLEKVKANPIKNFIFLAVIPLLFAVMVALIVATIAGYNVLNVAKSLSHNVPVAGGGTGKTASTKSVQNNGQDLQKLEVEVQQRDQQISQMQTKVNNLNQNLQYANLKNEQLQRDMNGLSNIQQTTKRALKDIVTTYETMSPQKAAPIIAKMSDTEALQILSGVKPQILASIMENMTSAQAARFTELITNKVNNGN